MDNINLLDFFNIGYIITNIILTYIIIKTYDFINGTKKVPTLHKRICLICSIIITTLFYVYIGKYTNYVILFNSAIATPVAWSWIIKPIFTKLGIDYRSIDTTII